MLGSNIENSLNNHNNNNNNNTHSNNHIETSEELSCFTMFTEYEKIGLERIVGQKRSNHIFDSDKSTFLFF
jgi:hypothetical protein